MTREKPTNRWPVLIIVAVGVALRWIQLGRASLWFDEGYTAWVVSLSPARIIHVLSNDTSPPLYYLLLRGWVECFGRSEWGLRSLSALAATGSMLGFYPLAIRLLRDRFAATVATALFAVSVMQVAYSHEARFYALIAFCAELELLLVIAVLWRRRWWHLPAMILCTMASIYISNLMIIYSIALMAGWLIFAGETKTGRRIVDIAILSLSTAILYLPWVPTMLAQSRSLRGNFWVDRPTGETLVRTVAMLAGVTDRGVGGWEFDRIAIVVAAFLAFILAGLISKQTRRTAAALCVIGLLPVFAIFVYSQSHQPLFLDRAFIPTTLITPMLIAMPMTRASGGTRWGWRIAGVGALAIGVLSLRGNYLGEHPENWRDVCRAINEGNSQRRIVVFAANEGELLYDFYLRGGDYSPSSRLIGAPMDFFANDPPRAMLRVQSYSDVSFLRQLVDRDEFDELDLVEAHVTWADPSRRTFNLLNRLLKSSGETEIDGINVYRFLPR